MELTDTQIGVLYDMVNKFVDKLGCYPDAEMDWDAGDVGALWDLRAIVMAEAKKRGFWWAK